jgi:lysophospholipase L1-like esterase
MRKPRTCLLGLAAAIAAAAAALLPSAAVSQELAAVGTRSVLLPSAPPALSKDCRSKRIAGDLFRRPLRALRRAVREGRQVKVLAIGSSSTEGVGASSASATYVAKLERTLEGTFKGLDFEVIGRGRAGEEAQGAADRMKREVEETRPDLVVWQVGTNDALRHVDLDGFKRCLKTTLAWLRQQKIDVLLVDPQYGDTLIKDAYYEKVVAAIAEIAREARVLLVDRFEAMRELHRQRGDRFYLTADELHMNDTGHRCMAEQLARSIVAGVLTADTETGQPVIQP